MPDKAKTPLLIMALVIVASLSLAGTGFYLLQQEKSKNLKLQDQLERLKIEQEAAEAKLAEYNKTISQLEVKLKDAQSEVYALTDNLEQERKTKEQALSQSRQLQQNIQQYMETAKKLESKLEQTQKDAEKIMLQLRSATSEKMELEMRIKTLEAQSKEMQAGAAMQGQEVELGTIVVVPEEEASKSVKKPAKEQAAKQPKEQPAKKAKEPQAADSLDGKVLVVNKEYNFIVISLGTAHGVKAGDIFALYRGNKHLGDVKIAKTHDTMSAADFLTPSIKDTVREGDRVVRKAK